MNDKEKRLREIYLARRRAAQGAGYKLPARYDGVAPVVAYGRLVLDKGKPPVWRRLVQILQKNHVHPNDWESYVSLQFDMFSPRSFRGDGVYHIIPPEPTAICSAKCIEAWREHRKKRKELFASILQAQATAMIAAISYRQKVLREDEDTSLVGVLCDESLDLSSLFRWAVGRSSKFARVRKVAESLTEEARQQFSRYPVEYREFWGSVLKETP